MHFAVPTDRANFGFLLESRGLASVLPTTLVLVGTAIPCSALRSGVHE